jgi:hypothetical protein
VTLQKVKYAHFLLNKSDREFLNCLDITSNFHTLAMIVLVGLQPVLHMPSCYSSFIITITPIMAYFNDYMKFLLRQKGEQQNLNTDSSLKNGIRLYTGTPLPLQ